VTVERADDEPVAPDWERRGRTKDRRPESGANSRRRARRQGSGVVWFLVLAAVTGVPAAPAFGQGGTDAGKAAEGEGKLTRKPSVNKEVEAKYTEEALEAEIEGTVKLRIRIEADGSVGQVEVIEGLGHGLDEAAKEAIRQFEFQPAEIDGEPTPVVVPFTIRFELPERPATFRGELRTSGDDAPVEGITVRIAYRGDKYEESPSGETTTEADGSFQFEEVPPGRYRVTLEGPQHETVQTDIELESGEQLEATFRVEAASVRLAGRVLEAGTRDRLAGVRVAVFRPDSGELLREAYTGAKGRFRIRGLEAGDYEVQVSSQDYATLRETETIGKDERVEVTYYLEADYYDQFSVRTTGERERESIDKKTIELEEVRRIPGSGNDPVRAVQNLPGVARPQFGSGQIVVRGTTPQSTKTFVEGDEIPLIYHFFNGPSVINAEMIESIGFHPGNYGARYGRALGGIVDIDTRTPKADRLHGFTEIDLLDATVQLEGPVTEDVQVAVSGRRSYADLVIQPFLPEEGNLRVAPNYYDYQGWVNWDVTEDHRLQLFMYGSNDTVEALFDTDDPPGNSNVQLTGLDLDNGFHRGQLRWEWQPEDRDLENTAMVSFGGNRFGFEAADNLFFRLDFLQMQARDDFRWEVADALTFKAGLDTQIGRSNYSAEIPALGQSDGGAGAPDVNVDAAGVVADGRTSWLVYPAVYTEFEIRPVDSLELVPGMRADYFSQIEEVTHSPRLTARWELTDELAAKGGIGRFTQPPDPAQTEPDFGNPDLTAQKTMQYAVGTEYTPLEFLEIDTTLFYRDLWNLVETTDEIRVDPETGEADPVIYNNAGEGRSYGLELLVRHRPANKFFGWIAYTLSRAERRHPETGEWRPFQYDQTHNLTAVAGYNLPWNIDVSARLRIATGNPQTPVVDSVWNADSDSYVPIRGQQFSERADTFHQLDLRVDKTFVFDTWRLGMYLDVINAYNARNQEGTRYNYDYTESAPITGLPLIPTLGINGRF